MHADVSWDDETSLDPRDWTEFRNVAARAVDDAAARIASLRDGPVWRPMAAADRAAFTGPVPTGPTPLSVVYAEFASRVLPFAMGNIHPRFLAWYMGSGDLTGALADFLAAIDGSNLGGGDTAASLVDRQVTEWLSAMMGFPEGASAALVSGGSMANIVGLTVARNAKAGIDLRYQGLAEVDRPLVFYASDQVHSCHDKAMNLLGLGAKALRRIPTDESLRMDVPALAATIDADLSRGLRPACVIATAGSTNTGSVDDLHKIADLCKERNLWMHVDGCIGALIAIAPENAATVAGIERADSLALDLHKWLHAPFDVGCILVRDGTIHRETFAEHPEYLMRTKRGIAAAEFLSDFTTETTRSFRALKVWMMLKHHGTEAFGRLIDRNIAQARYLASLIEESDALELTAPVATSIVCFRLNPGGLSERELREVNTEVMLRLQESGVAVLSDTTVNGRHCLRAALCNHRTDRSDIDLLVAETERVGRTVLNEGVAGAR